MLRSSSSAELTTNARSSQRLRVAMSLHPLIQRSCSSETASPRLARIIKIAAALALGLAFDLSHGEPLRRTLVEGFTERVAVVPWSFGIINETSRRLT